MASASTWRMKSFVFMLCLYGVLSTEHEKTPSTDEDVKPGDLVVVVNSQHHPYHLKRAALFQLHFEDQVASLPEGSRPDLVLTHEKWPETKGAWTVFPLVLQFVELYKEKKWLIFCGEDTRLDVQHLIKTLQQHDPELDPFLGRALKDKQTTIIHHFAFSDDPSSFSYPDFGAGFAISMTLVERIADKLTPNGYDPKIQFSIDSQHEFALYVRDNFETRLTSLCEFCGTTTSVSKDCQCATWQPVRFPTDCGPPLKKSDLFTAVKTCSKFHEDRVPVVKKTWGSEADLIEYFSDEEDSSIPTVNLGIPNTERGHCGKTQAILQRVADSSKLTSDGWLLIADDDTIINLELLRRLLPCYQAEEPVFLGERYGFAVSSGHGYNYITGGGGMLFNRAAVTLLGAEFKCPSNEAPDDMLLGMFFARREHGITHSPYFHQARPEDYSEDMLATQIPVSFHKHWNTDPYKVYQRLKAANLPESPDVHDEL